MEGVDPGWKVPAELMGKAGTHGLQDTDQLAAFLEGVEG